MKRGVYDDMTFNLITNEVALDIEVHLDVVTEGFYFLRLYRAVS